MNLAGSIAWINPIENVECEVVVHACRVSLANVWFYLMLLRVGFDAIDGFRCHSLCVVADSVVRCVADQHHPALHRSIQRKT